jgi:very-short-patch-repair endonuclease
MLALVDRARRNDEVLLQLRPVARRQLGLVSRRQVLETAATPRWLGSRLKTGDLQIIEAGFYLLPGYDRTWDVEALAACLSRGAAARLGFSSAANVFDLVEGQRHDGHLEVVVPHARACPSTDAVTLHRTRRLTSADVAKYGALPVTTVARTIIDLAARLDDDKVERLVDDSLVRRLTSVPLLSSCLSRNAGSGRRGCGSVRSALALWDAGTMQSHAEVVVARWLRGLGFATPVAQMAVKGPDGRRWFVDFGWPAFRVVLEVDSFQHHHGPRKLSRDHERRSAIEAEGWRVLSTTVAEIKRGGNMLKAALTALMR